MDDTQAVRPDPAAVRAMFGRIARRYDTANTVLSFGIHHRWRTFTVRASGVTPGQKVLDCATGTGDLAFAFARAGAEVVATDFCPEMLEEAAKKHAERGGNIRFSEADVLALPFDAATFDVASIAFGIRNVPDPKRALTQLHRVLKPGGVLCVLEFGDKQVPVWRHVFGAFQKHVLPRLGGLVTGERGAYEYLQKTSSRFPCGEDFVALASEAAPWKSVDVKSLSGGIAYLYTARK